MGLQGGMHYHVVQLHRTPGDHGQLVGRPTIVGAAECQVVALAWPLPEVVVASLTLRHDPVEEVKVNSCNLNRNQFNLHI